MWAVCSLSEIQQLQKLQSRTVRIIIVSNYDAPSKPLLETLNWKTTMEMIQFESQIMVLNSINRLASLYPIDLFVANSSNSLYDLISTATDLKILRRTSLNGQRSFAYRSARLWNRLPDQSKRATDLICSKRLLLTLITNIDGC